MSKDQLEIRIDERQKIGKYLHDALSNDLMALQFYLTKIKDNPSSNEIHEIIDKIDYIRRNIRAISHVYTSHISKDTNLIDLKSEIKGLLIDSAHIHDDIEFNFHAFPKKNELLIAKNICLEIIMIIKEIILNAVNHGKSRAIEVNLTQHEKELSIIISDDGIGFDINKKMRGIGLKNIQDRMKSINGKAIIDSQPNYGTTIILELTQALE